MYLLGYIPADNRLYLGDKELSVVSFQLLLSVLEYQTAVMRRDFETADKVLPTIPKEQRTRVAHFLEKQGFKQQALAVSSDPEHKFELAVQLGDLKVAYDLACEAQSEQKWKQLAELATASSKFDMAQECLQRAQDFGGLLLLATSSGWKLKSVYIYFMTSLTFVYISQEIPIWWPSLDRLPPRPERTTLHFCPTSCSATSRSVSTSSSRAGGCPRPRFLPGHICRPR